MIYNIFYLDSALQILDRTDKDILIIPLTQGEDDEIISSIFL